MKAIETITFAVNSTKPGALEAARFLADLAEREGVKTKSSTDYPLPPDALEGQDLCIAIGGDGTLLGVLDAALNSGAAVLGVNLGKLGFLATYTQEEAGKRLSALIKGNYSIADRSVLECTTSQGESVYGLNDVVLKETEGRGLIRLQVSSNGNPVSEYHCDGLIFATPTGSTAYNLSAGGPIIGPRVSAIAMTPICPHTLGNRSVIFDNSSEITVVSGDSETCPRITVDGRVRFEPNGNFPIKITVAEKVFRLMQNPDHSHFAIVRGKLDWGDPAIR
ncbi:NAD(+) kinase [Coraliomargarita sinensis]|uniref:NAD kinase n=1 Tax=Coraliomargarita sinensis TaxID=2174842 RepID=A0A317ZPF5_9BACT|nr:NAD(+)/NADH kinase [Coraliomargarita sinensis]PXA05748.1 NAD(+) kinase [Coraliomargarita sinensis]